MRGDRTDGVVSVRPATNSRDIRRFVNFPRTVYADDPWWVAPLPAEVIKRLDPTRNPFYASARRELFLASRDGEVVGTVAAIVNDAHNRMREDAVGYFGFFETVNDPAVVRALLAAAAGWLIAAGATTMRGPVNGSSSDETGLLIGGFDTRPALWQGHHPRFYRERLEELPFTTFADVLAYEMTYDDLGRDLDNLPPVLLRASQRARAAGATLRTPTAASWADDVVIAHRLYVDSHRTIADHSGMSWQQFSATTASLRRIIDLDLTIVVEVDGKPVGFAVAMPEVNEALAASGRHRGPWTPLRVLRNVSRVRSASIKLLSTLPEYRSRGLPALLCAELARRLVARGYERCEMSLVSELNRPMTAVLDRLGARVYRRYRVYETALAGWRSV